MNIKKIGFRRIIQIGNGLLALGLLFLFGAIWFSTFGAPKLDTGYERVFVNQSAKLFYTMIQEKVPVVVTSRPPSWFSIKDHPYKLFRIDDWADPLIRNQAMGTTMVEFSLAGDIVYIGLYGFNISGRPTRNFSQEKDQVIVVYGPMPIDPRARLFDLTQPLSEFRLDQVQYGDTRGIVDFYRHLLTLAGMVNARVLDFNEKQLEIGNEQIREAGAKVKKIYNWRNVLIVLAVCTVPLRLIVFRVGRKRLLDQSGLQDLIKIAKGQGVEFGVPSVTRLAWSVDPAGLLEKTKVEAFDMQSELRRRLNLASDTADTNQRLQQLLVNFMEDSDWWNKVNEALGLPCSQTNGKNLETKRAVAGAAENYLESASWQASQEKVDADRRKNAQENLDGLRAHFRFLSKVNPDQQAKQTYDRSWNEDSLQRQIKFVKRAIELQTAANAKNHEGVRKGKAGT